MLSHHNTSKTVHRLKDRGCFPLLSLRAWQASEGKTSAQSDGISSDRNIRDFLWRWSNYFDQTPTNLPSSFHKLFIAELFFTCLRRELGKGINLSE